MITGLLIIVVVAVPVAFGLGIRVGFNSYEKAADAKRPCERGEPGAMFDYVEPYRGKERA